MIIVNKCSREYCSIFEKNFVVKPLKLVQPLQRRYALNNPLSSFAMAVAAF